MSARHKKRERHYFREGDLLKVKHDIDCFILMGKKRGWKMVSRNSKVIFMSSHRSFTDSWDEWATGTKKGESKYTTGAQMEIRFVHDGQMKMYTCSSFRVYQAFKLVQKS